MFDSLRNLLVRRAPHLQSAHYSSLLLLKKEWKPIAEKIGIPESVEPKEIKRKKLILACSSRPEASHVHRFKERIRVEVNAVLTKEKVEEVQCIVK